MSSPCVAFCLVTSVVAFVISAMMSRETLATFTIPAMRNEWDLQQKAIAVRNAGFMYLFIALALTAKGFYGTPRTRNERAESYVTGYSTGEVMPLVRSASSAQGSLLDEDEDEDMSPLVEGGIPTGREGSAYGAVEMTLIRRSHAAS
jgi:hypothetical protein